MKVECLPVGFRTQQCASTVDALPPGTPVTIGESIRGIVHSVLIDSEGLQYKVAWWDGNDRKCEWLLAAEVTAESAPLMQIGFRANGQQ